VSKLQIEFSLSYFSVTYQPRRYYMNFNFDTTRACTVTIHILSRVDEATQRIVPEVFADGGDDQCAPANAINFPKQLGQKFRQKDHPLSIPFDASKYSSDQLEVNLEEPITSQAIPIIVRLQTRSEPDEAPISPQWQTTFMSLVRGRDDLYKPVVLQQNIFMGGELYELQDIYGYQDEETPSSTGADDELELQDAAECVICMSEKRNTAVLPCRHMCLCMGCAQTLRLQVVLVPYLLVLDA
jgi:hypothetical protein